MKILFVAQAVSPHTARWINQLQGLGWDIRLFDMLGSFPHAELRGITEYSLLFPRKISPTKPVSYGHPFFLKYGLDPFPLSLLGFFTRRMFRSRVPRLIQVIREFQPDVIHSMEMQSESYPLLEILDSFGGKLPAPWVITTWGSDIYHFRQFPEHLKKIQQVLANCDYLLPDCARDERISRELGFKGAIPMVLPAIGGYSVSEMRSHIKENIASKRRLIMLKGYQGWAGRALIALEALESCAEILKGYEIVVYLASAQVIEKVKSIKQNGKLNIRVLSRSPYQVILESFGQARVAIAINQTDGVPISMLEAMTMGAFPIQSDTESTAEWIMHETNGLLVDPENVAAIEEAIRRALENDNLVDEAAEANFRLISQKIDVAVVKPKIIQMYRYIANQGAEGSANSQVPAFSVSVVITAYNAANWIEETLNSILAQTYPVLEVIVVDDGSTDNTAEKVLSYGGIVKYIYQDNSGQPSARNHGISSAKGEYIAFVDADDYWHVRKIEKQVNLIRSGGTAWVVCDGEWVNENKEVVNLPVLGIQEGDVLEKLLMGNFIMSATPVIRRDVFDSVGYFNEDPEARIGEDWDMWLRIASRFPLGVVHEKLSYVRLHQSSMLSTTNMRKKIKGFHGVVERAVGRGPRRLTRLKNFAFANIYHQAGVQLTKQNEYSLAREFFFRELEYRPANIESWVYLFMMTAGPGVSGILIKLKRFLGEQFDKLKKR